VRWPRWGSEPRPVGEPNPFEAYMFAACVAQGAVVLLGAARPTSIELALPTLLRVLWAVLLLVGGVAVLTGLYWPGSPLTGVEIKRPGLVAVGGAALAYGVALLPFGAAGMVVAIANVSFSLACAVRVWQVTRRVRAVRAHLVDTRLRHGT
jgi:hypothetical protein